MNELRPPGSAPPPVPAPSRIGAFRPDPLDPLPPNGAAEWSKRTFLSGNSTPHANRLWLAEGVPEREKCLTYALFWPSANSLAWRKVLDDMQGGRPFQITLT